MGSANPKSDQNDSPSIQLGPALSHLRNGNIFSQKPAGPRRVFLRRWCEMPGLPTGGGEQAVLQYSFPQMCPYKRLPRRMQSPISGLRSRGRLWEETESTRG